MSGVWLARALRHSLAGFAGAAQTADESYAGLTRVSLNLRRQASHQKIDHRARRQVYAGIRLTRHSPVAAPAPNRSPAHRARRAASWRRPDRATAARSAPAP